MQTSILKMLSVFHGISDGVNEKLGLLFGLNIGGPKYLWTSPSKEKLKSIMILRTSASCVN